MTPPIPQTKRFLILTSDSGFGHRSAANSIAKALELEYPHSHVTLVVNPLFEKAAPRLLQQTELNYDRTVKKSPTWYRFTYEISDSRPASALVENTLALALYRNMKLLIRDTRPDAILNTNQLFNAPVGAVLNSLARRPDFYTVVTDLADVHAMWFNSNPDRFFVASEMVKAKAVASGIPPEKITISGIPVDPELCRNQATKPDLRLRLGLDPHLTTILVVGSQRVSGILDHLEALQTVSFPFQVVVIAGGDSELFARSSEHRWNFPIQIKNFVDNMPDWMRCSDILVTKAGGLILSEGLAAGLPVILIDYLPGQEEGNVRFILDRQAGVMVHTPWEFSQAVENWLREDGRVMDRIAANARHTGRPDAAFLIAKALWNAAEKYTPDSILRMQAWRNLE